NLGSVQVGGTLPGGPGDYLLSDGALNITDELIVGYSTGTFDQSGGTVTLGSVPRQGNLRIATNPVGGAGTYNLSGGSLTVTGQEYLGTSAAGTFAQTGGTHTLIGTLTIAGSGGAGTYSLQGGVLSASTISINSGGLLDAAGGLFADSITVNSGGTVNASATVNANTHVTQGTFI